MSNAKVGIYGRTGGLTERVYIDDLQVNAGSLAAPVITRLNDATAPELGIATFNVIVEGLPPFSYQWFSNSVAIPGATGSGYTTPTAYRTMEGTTYSVAVSNPCGTTTGSAHLHVNQDTVAPFPLWISLDGTGTTLLLDYSEDLNLASGTNGANYSVNNGVSVTGAAYVPGTANRYVALTLSSALNPVNCNVLTISGVNDLSGYNPANARYPIVTSAGFPTSGANNLVVIEAEDYDVNRSPGTLTANTRWVLRSSIPGYVGKGYMRTDPEAGVNIGSTAATIPGASSMDYAINFAAAGTYYVWARGATPVNDGSDNSVHIDVDNVSQGATAQAIGNGINNWGGDAANTSRFGWVNHAGAVATRASINIATPGRHLITLAMREDGLNFDRFLLTTDVNFSPGAVNDPGPAATIKPGVGLSIVHNSGSGATISWPGQGWLLQGTTELNSNPAATVWQDLPQFSSSPLIIPSGYFGNGPTNVFFRLICK